MQTLHPQIGKLNKRIFGKTPCDQRKYSTPAGWYCIDPYRINGETLPERKKFFRMQCAKAWRGGKTGFGGGENHRKNKYKT